MKTPKLNKSRMLHFWLLVAMLIIFALIMAFRYHKFNNKLAENINKNTISILSEVSAQIVDTVKNKSNSIFKILDSIAISIGEEDTIYSPKVLEMLKKQKTLNNFSSIGVVTREGKLYYYNNITDDIKDKKYFKDALLGNHSISSPKFDSCSLTYAVPIVKNQKIEGVLITTFQNNYLAELIDLHIFDDVGTLHIINSEGRILTNNISKLSRGNFFDMLSASKIKGNKTIIDVKKDLKGLKKGVITYIPVNKEKYCAYYEPLNFNDWHIVSIVPQSYIENQCSSISGMSLRLVIEALSIFLILSALIVYILHHTFKKFAVMNRKFETLVSNVPGGMFCFYPNENNKFGFISDGLLKIFGYSHEEFKENFNNSFSDSIYYKDREHTLKIFNNKESLSSITEAEYRIKCSDGEIRWLLGRGQIIYENAQNPMCYVVVMDITKSKETLESLRLNEERYRLVVAQTESMIYEYSANGSLLHSNLLFKMKFGYPLATEGFPEIFIKNDYIHLEDAESFLNMYYKSTPEYPTSSVEVRIKKADGCYIWCSVQNTTIFSEDGTPKRYIGGILDIDKRHRETESLKHLAQLDPLTALYNKTSIQSRIEDCLLDNSGNHALMFIDVDNFKAINDNLGHLFGDAILSELASNLQKLAGSNILAGRVGGDEFVLFLKDCYDLDEICQRAEEVCSIFREYSSNSQNVPISCSIGIALYPSDGKTYEELTQKADSALYEAKNNGKNCFELYSDSTKLITRKRKLLLTNFSPRQEYNSNHFTSFIFDILYQAHDISSALTFVMSVIGQHCHISRIYIKELISSNNTSFLSYEWSASGISAMSEKLQFPHTACFHEIKNSLKSDGVIVFKSESELNDLPSLKNHFIDDELCMFMGCAILENGVVSGLVCFEQIKNSESLDDSEIRSLSVIGKVIGSYLTKLRSKQIFRQQYNSLQSVIDCQNVWLYVIDAETNKLLYINRRIAKDFKNAAIGTLCYESLDKSMPCAHCLANRLLLNSGTVHERYFSEKTNRWMLYSATRFLWPLGNKNAILITYRYADEIQDLGHF